MYILEFSLRNLLPENRGNPYLIYIKITSAYSAIKLIIFKYR